jgi:uncharacterized protein YkwD
VRTSLAALVFVWGCTSTDGISDDDDDGSTPAAIWPEAWAELEAGVIEICNAHRTFGATCGGTPMAGGLDHLELDPVLRGTARAHSVDMATRGFFDHDNPDGDGPFDRIEAAGFTGAQPWGENIAGGTGTAEAVMDQWMDSVGHCMNIMEPSFLVIGVGYDFDETSQLGHYWTQNFAGSH